MVVRYTTQRNVKSNIGTILILVMKSLVRVLASGVEAFLRSRKAFYHFIYISRKTLFLPEKNFDKLCVKNKQQRNEFQSCVDVCLAFWCLQAGLLKYVNMN